MKYTMNHPQNTDNTKPVKYKLIQRQVPPMIKKIISYGLRFLQFIVHFNVFIAAKLFLVPLFQQNLPFYDRYAYKHTCIKKYLKRKYRKVIKRFKQKQNSVDASFADHYPVWFMWWQGADNMPPIVRACYRSLTGNANGHKINLVTKDNFHNFAAIPAYIIKKMNKKIISLTHFSDILRMCLLYEHGGLWLDSTVLLTAPLPSLPPICAHLGFWSPKDDGKILKTWFGAENWIVREGKWLTFCLYLSRHNLLAGIVRALFFEYFKNKNIPIDYFLFDYFISLSYDALQEIRILIDSVPSPPLHNNSQVHEILHRLHLDYEYNKELFDEVCAGTCFHKLSWKENYNMFTETGKLTNYGYIINTFSLP
jgi:hypothetical protein